MKAAGDFLTGGQNLSLEDLAPVSRIEINLYGSLSLTGKEHGTDRSIVG